jgi:light-regulated signal transduction histidine kinase (bacteriophytochrome)
VAWKLALREKAEAFVHEFRFRRAEDGEYRWMLAVAVSLTDPTGTSVEWVGTLTDIDDQKRHTQILESQVRERTAELQRSNEELEKFAYIASHDLQEPLRKIQAFGDRLKTKCHNDLSENGKEYVDRMHAAASRMRRLIDDLLTFSRVTTQQRPFSRVDLQRLVTDVLSDLDLRLHQTGGTVEVGNLPVIDADATQMRQLFQNLLVNAVKFHRPDVPPVVEVEAESFDQLIDGSASEESIPMYRITVRDNGIGFEEKYRDRIFDVFQRLHGRNQYEGTGVGLAICRKIVERHGGSITASGREGEGATFTVVLPASQPHTSEASNEDDQQDHTDYNPAGRRRPG